MEVIWGQSFTDLVRDVPLYLSLVRKYIGIRLFHEKHAIFGAADICNVCNLHCEHCYWWLNRKEEEGLSAEEWRQVIRNTLKKQKVMYTCIAGGEPLLRPDIVKVFCEEMPRRVSVVTNGTFPMPRFEGLYFYFVSIDGTKEVHDQIRGEGSYDKTKKNILDYISKYDSDEYPAWKDIWLSITINSLNYRTVEDYVEEWKDIVNKVAIQFHTPFMKGDPLWLPFGEKRDWVVNKLIELRKKYPDFIANPEKQLQMFKKSWGGKGTTPVNCPTWAVIALDHMGRRKSPCCIASADEKAVKPICEDCGITCYATLYTYGVRSK